MPSRRRHPCPPRVCCAQPRWNRTGPASGSANATGGYGSSTTSTTPSSWSSLRAAKPCRWPSWANTAPTFRVSDRYGAQLGWAARENQVCLSHLIRDVHYAIDAGDSIFAPGLRHLLGRACRIGQRRQRLADATLKTYAARLEADLDRLMRRTPTQAAGLKLQRAIEKIRRHMFVFMTNRAIPPTNNGSERALRPRVTFRKNLSSGPDPRITNGFRSEWGAALYADIRSVVETARRRSIRAIDAIRLTLEALPIPSPA